MDFVLVPSKDIVTKPGKLFIEGRVRDEIEFEENSAESLAALKRQLETHLSKHDRALDLLEDILSDERSAQNVLGPLHADIQQTLQSLTAVEYVGPDIVTTTFSSAATRIEVQIYKVYSGSRDLAESKDFPQGEVTSMPHHRFDGTWDRLVFADDVKGDLIWMMTNILRFSAQFSEDQNGDMYPLILLHGPPGTGKTSLCQGLAQKIAIRLGCRYDYTRLVQINTATLMSKYYSESAKQVDEIFTKIARTCQDEPNTFTCVLIDEVESIAASREFSTVGGESQDSLRATNALLTGLDKTKGYRNLIYLCTSNMLRALDSAFVDRCGLNREISTPSLASQYEILRQRLLGLISSGIIQSVQELPPFEDAELSALADVESAPARLLTIAKLTNKSNGMSGRHLAQLPKRAVLQNLREEECNLDTALTFIERLVKPVEDKVFKFDCSSGEDRKGTEIAIRGKRTLKMWFEDDLEVEQMEWRNVGARKRGRQH